MTLKSLIRIKQSLDPNVQCNLLLFVVTSYWEPLKALYIPLLIGLPQKPHHPQTCHYRKGPSHSPPTPTTISRYKHPAYLNSSSWGPAKPHPVHHSPKPWKYLLVYLNPYAAGGWFDQFKMMQKKLKNDWNPGKWVLIWEYSARALQWIPTWQGLDYFQKSLRPCNLDENNLSIGRVKGADPRFLCRGFIMSNGDLIQRGRFISLILNITKGK